MTDDDKPFATRHVFPTHQVRDATIGLVKTGEDLFLIIDGITIAKRGQPGTPEAETWVSLVPGWSVTGTDEIRVTYDSKQFH